MITVRIYCYDDSVDIEIPESQFYKLQSFINRQDNMQIFKIY